MEAQEVLIRDYLKHIGHYGAHTDDLVIADINQKCDEIIVNIEYGNGHYKNEVVIKPLDLMVFVYNNKPEKK